MMGTGKSGFSKLDILRERRSIRSFARKEVPRTILMDLIDHAILAPSATDRQGWRFIIVTDPSLKQRMVDAGGSAVINRAPCGILVIYENTTRNIQYHDDYQSAAAGIQNLLLATQARGLGTCWICHLPTVPFLRKMFNIPREYSPIAYVAIGYPGSGPVKNVRRKHRTEDIVSENTFPDKVAPSRGRGFSLYTERFLVWLYGKLPVGIKKKYVNRIIDRKFVKKFEND